MTYIFTIAAVNLDQIADEIATAGLPAAQGYEIEGFNLMITYAAALSDSQASSLTSVVSRSVANPAYVTLATQAQIATLIGYLNNTDTTVANTARAVMIATIAPKLPPAVLIQINTAIAAKLGG